MSDLISRQAVIDLLKKNVSKDIEEVIVTDKNIKLIESMPCAYNVDAVVAEMEYFEKLAEDRWVNGTSNHAYQEHKCWVKAIDIVRKGGVE